MSHFQEYKCQNNVIVALPTNTSAKDRMELLNLINQTVQQVFVELRRNNVNFLPLEVTTTLESME